MFPDFRGVKTVKIVYFRIYDTCIDCGSSLWRLNEITHLLSSWHSPESVFSEAAVSVAVIWRW